MNSSKSVTKQVITEQHPTKIPSHFVKRKALWELQCLIEAMLFHQLSHGWILTEYQEEKLHRKIEGCAISISIIPIWKWLLSQPKIPHHQI